MEILPKIHTFSPRSNNDSGTTTTMTTIRTTMYNIYTHPLIAINQSHECC